MTYYVDRKSGTVNARKESRVPGFGIEKAQCRRTNVLKVNIGKHVDNRDRNKRAIYTVPTPDYLTFKKKKKGHAQNV